MPLSKSDFADGLKAIKFPDSSSAAASAWTDAFQKYIANCTQVATFAAGVQAFHASIAGAFDPTDSTTAFATSLGTALTAGVSALVLVTTFGTTLPGPAPFTTTFSNADNEADPRDKLASDVHNWIITCTYTGTPPSSPPGNLS